MKFSLHKRAVVKRKHIAMSAILNEISSIEATNASRQSKNRISEITLLIDIYKTLQSNEVRMASLKTIEQLLNDCKDMLCEWRYEQLRSQFESACVCT